MSNDVFLSINGSDIYYDQYKQINVVSHDDGKYKTTFISRDLRGEVCYLCNKGWELTAKDWGNQCRAGNHRLCHESCLSNFMSLTEYIKYSRLFDSIVEGNSNFKIEEIPNQYFSSGHWKPSWHKVTVGEKVVFEVGRRKRVDSITAYYLDGSVIPKQPLTLAFEDMKDTKEIGIHKILLHAWTEKQTKDYIVTILKNMS